METPWEKAVTVEPFVKHDAEKLRMDLITPEFLEGLAGVLTHGAAKYAPDNWKNCDKPFERYYAALQRHLVAYAKGDDLDAESGYHHLYHAACCLMFLTYFQRETSAFTGMGLTPSDDYQHNVTMMPYRPLPHKAGE